MSEPFLPLPESAPVAPSVDPAGESRPRRPCLHELFEEQARRIPDTVAVVGRGESWSYGELNRRSDRLALRLRRLGVTAEVPVGLCLERTPRMVASLLAVLKAGGAYLPLDPRYPPERLRFMVEDAGAPLVLTQASLAGLFTDLSSQVVCLEDEEPESAVEGGPPSAPGAGNLAYLIYTSGSTGRPKGVAIEHRSAVGLVAWAAEAFSPAELSGVLASTSICFDLSVFELFVPLSLGGRVILAENALELPALPAAGEVTLVNTVPSAIAELLRQQAVPSSVRTVNLAGEPLSRALADGLYALDGIERVYDLYGPSEDTTYSTWVLVPRNADGPPAIGRALPGSCAYVLDRDLEPVPAGIEGELHLSGAGLARGYLERPELTAERFVPDPYASEAGERMYRTGDLARYRADGDLDFLGRLDHQVKVRGFRIELGEVEAALIAHPEIEEAVVVAREDLPGGRGLAAYLVPRAGADLEVAELRRFLAHRLPDYMLPAAFVPLTALPRTPNGKLDRRALPAPATSETAETAATERPQGAVEETVASLCAEALGVPRLGRHDNFLERGGHSLLASQILARLRRDLSCDLSLGDFFDAPTVAGLAARIESAQPSRRCLPPLEAVPRGELPLLSFSQQMIWLLSRLAPDSAAYNIPVLVELRGPVDAALLEESLQGVIRRHESLRTTFVEVEGLPRQRIFTAVPVVLPVIDLRLLPEQDASREAERLAAAEAALPVPLAASPPFRATLIRRRGEENLLLLTIHHIAADGWSIAVFLSELVALYERCTTGKGTALPPLPVQYADFAHWQRRLLQGALRDELLGYWKERLAGSPQTLELPADRPRPPVQSLRGRHLRFVLSPEVARRAKRLGNRRGATLFMVALAAFDALLYRYTGQPDLLVGVPHAGRGREELELLIGCFTNTVVLRCTLNAHLPFEEVLARVRRAAIEAHSHQGLPFELLVEELRPERALSHHPLVQVLLAFQNLPRPALRLHGSPVDWSELDSGTSKLDLTLFLEAIGGTLHANLEYRTDLFDDATASRMARHFERLLWGAVEDPQRTTEELPLLDEGEHRQALVEQNNRIRRIPGPLPARAPAAAGGPELPRSTLEEVVAGIWSEVLDRPRISLHDSFFDLGGHSLLAAQAISRVLEIFGIAVPLTDLFRHPSAAAFAHHVERVRRSERGLLAPPIVPVPRDQDLPLSFAQERMWLLEQIQPGNPSYFSTPSMRIRGGLEALSLGQALAAIRIRHEVLRTTLRLGSDGAVQVIAPAGGWYLPVLDLEDLPRRQREAEAFRLAGEAARRPFDLARGPLLRATLLRLSAVEHILLLGIHHVIYDGLSLGIFAHELATLYRSFAAGEPSPLAPLQVQYADFAAWQRSWLQGKVYDNLLAYWKRQLGEDPPVLVLPVDHPRPLGRPARGAAQSFALPPALAEPLRALARRQGVTPFMTMAALFQLLLHRSTGQDRIPVGTPIANRNRVEVEPLIGCFINTLVLCTDLSGDPPGTELLRRAAEVALGAYDHQDFPFERLVAHLQSRRDLAVQPLFQVLLLLESFRSEPFTLPGLGIEPLSLGGVSVPVDLTLGLSEQNGALQGSLSYNADLFDAVTITRLLSHLERLARGLVEAPAKRISELPFLGEAERHQLLVERSATAGNAGSAERAEPAARSSSPSEGPDEAARRTAEKRDKIQARRAELSSRRARLSSEQRSALERFVTDRVTAPPSRTQTIPRRSEPGPVRLSFAQERLWFLDQLQPGSPAYNIPSADRFGGPLRLDILRRSLGEIVRRHEALRTAFAAGEMFPVQVIAPPAPVELPVVDLATLPAPAREAEALCLARQDATRPFDLARGPLFRVTLVRLGAEDHVAVMTMHHIVSDGWSMGILTSELTALVDAFSAGRSSPLEELPIQYPDFAVWQRSWMQGEVLTEHLEFWKTALAGAPSVLELPTDRPRPKIPSHQGGTVPLSLSLSLADTIRALCRSLGCTLFMAGAAAFQALLGRYSGQQDVCLGTPIAGRRHVETEQLIGFFINTLVLRADLSGDPTVRVLLERVRRAFLEAHAHQDLPFEKLVEELHPQRNLGVTPLFQVMFVLQSALRPAASPPADGAAGEGAELDSGTAKFDLTLALSEARLITGALEYSGDLFDRATALRIGEHFGALLEGMVATPEALLWELPLLRPAEQAQALSEWNDTARTRIVAGCVHELFERQAARRPQATALVFAGRALTYGELNRWSNRLAHELGALGIGPEVRVAICFERSLEMVVALLAVLKAGGAYVPLDPQFPRERLTFMVEDAGALVLLTQTGLQELFSGVKVQVLCPEDAPSLFGQEPADDRRSGVEPCNLAYVIYTSGSTGRPKGVEIEHRSLSHYLDGVIERLGLDESAVFATVSTLAADLGNTVVFASLAMGGCLHIISSEHAADPRAFAGYMRQNEIECLKIVPSHLSVLRAAGGSDVLPRQRLILGGEASAWSEIDALREAAPGCRVFNHYGPTETTVGVLTYPAAGGVRQGANLPLGRPLPDTRVYVLDPRLQPVPVGAPGEICIGGRGLARGYASRPGLTAERFVPSPWGDTPGSRLYRTGDRARLLPAGELELLGRIDHQVKIRGYRVELGEVESALRDYPAVRDAVVLARLDARGERSLTAYVTAPVPCPAGELRRFLGERLPAYMIPAAFAVLGFLPLTPNGKVDRQALERLDPEGSEARDTFVAPRRPAEQLMADLWSEVLGVARVGVEDDFFDLGGHSLLATRLVSRVRAAFGVDLPVRSLFESPTVSGLVLAVEGLRSGDASAMPPLAPLPRQSPLPLSFAQERLWFIDQMQPGSTAYNIPTAMRLEGDLDLAALAWSLSQVVRRHEVLRTRFVARDGVPVQEVDPPAPVTLPVVDLSSLPEARRERTALDLAHHETCQPFDLARGPLLRVGLLRLAPRDHVVLVSMHHIVSDGWSRGIFVTEVGALYDAWPERRRARLPELPVQYADYARWQRDWLQGEVLQARVDFWRRQLTGAPPVLDLPTDRPRATTQTFRGATEPWELSAGLSQRLRALGRREGATSFMVLLAAFQALLSRYSGQEDLCVGTPIAGRNVLAIEPLIGLFVNTLVLRTDLSGGPSFRDLLGRVRETSLDAHSHQEVPFERLVEELAPERSFSHSPLFQVMFVLQNTPAATLPAAKLRMRPAELPNETAKFDLSLALVEDDRGFQGGWEHRTDLFDRCTIARLGRDYAALLAAAAEAPETPLADLPLLGDAQRHQLVNEWGVGPSADAAGGSALERVEAWAARSPRALAVVGPDGERVSYGELAARVRALAHRLRREGVGPEKVVGIFLERSVDVVAAVWATLRAGGAWLPLDPAYPPERVSFILQDAGVRAVLASRALRERLPALEATVIELDRSAAVEEDPDDAFPRPEPDGLAYVIYTSGSTGRPKGVEITHRGLANLIGWYERSFGPGPGCRLTQLASPAFDASVLEIWPCLATGATLYLAPEPVRASPLDLLAWLASEEITHGFLPTPLAEGVLQEELPRDLALRFLLTGGDRLRRAPARGLPFRLINLYGPTEGSVVATEGLVESGSPGAPPIGGPIRGIRAAVLDRAGRAQPMGVAGELCLGGAGVARGYLRRPELTAERFVPEEGGGRLYRTGDRVRWLTDGRLEHLGRLDEQVKVRGFRIEPGEIEAALATHPAVRGAVVLVREDARGERSLVGYVAADAPPEPGELRSFLGRTLPEHMIPAAFVTLPVLPLTSHGKIDRRALAARAPEGDSRAPAPGRPLTPIEEIVTAIWSEVLQVEQVGPDDDFFQLGGHSLLATRMVSRLHRAFRVELPLRDLFEAPTVALLAVRLARALGTGGRTAPPILPVPRNRPLPLSFGQQRLWFLDRLEPGSSLYSVPLALRVQAPMRADLLALGLSEIARRHEVLRTTFRLVQGEPVQVVAPPAPVPLPVIDLSALPETARQAQAGALAEGLGQVSFDLERGPLFRAGLVLLGANDSLVLAVMHHVLCDAWSLEIFEREAGELYSALSEGRPPRLPELPVQYADYASWQRGWLQGEVLESELSFWRERLSGAPPALELPTDRPRPALQTYRGERLPFLVPAGISRNLEALSRTSSATLFMTVLAALQVLLSRHTGATDLCVGTPIAGRNRTEVEPLIGFFVNMLVLRVDLSGDPSFRTVLERAREASLESFTHQDLPFEKLVEELQLGRDLSRSPLVQVVFQLRHVTFEAAPPEARSAAADPGGQIAKFDLVLNADATRSGLAGTWKYNTDLFDRTTMARMSGHLEILLAALAADPGLPVSSLPVLAEAERHQLVAEWGSPSGLHEEFLLQERFAERAKEAPEATAVVHQDERLSYGELDARANRLAHFLLAAGLQPEERVGLFLERSCGMVVAILGVLKAGASYVPLDPGYPRERLAFLLADSGLRLLVTQSWLADNLPELPPGARLVCLDRDRAQIDGSPANAPQTTCSAGALAYVIYTSGSTGRPKGVGVSHGNVGRLFAATEARFHFGAEDVWTLFHSYAFDFSVWELWGALLYGGRLVVVPHRVSRAPDDFRDLLVREGVTVLNQTPAAFRQLARADEARGDRGLRGLRWVVFGGEALDMASLRPWMARYGEERPRLVNMYGITETTVHVTWRDISARDLAGGSVVGRPIPDLGLYLLDRAGSPVPLGTPGEIHVGGAGVARGYLGRPELTAERFVPDPFGVEPGGRLYRSGDLARHRPDGDLEYLGRIDHQVKIRGFRIELGEIEAALRSHPAVREAAVVVDDAGEGGERRLAAYVVPQGDREGCPDPAELRSFLAASLPDYMLPAAWSVLAALPLTPHGKLDRRALPHPDAGRQPETEYAPPRTGLERFLAGLWREVLKVDRIGLHDDFFALGGSSISGAILINRLQEELREIVHVVAIFDAPTVARLAEYLLAEHRQAVARRFGAAASAGAAGAPTSAARIDAARIAEIRALVRPLAPLATAERTATKNRPAVFVLSPPRSGTTLLRVLLAGHPRLFAPPELELLSFPTLAARRAAFSGRDRFWLEGLLRAVMEIRSCDAGDAERLVEEWERNGLPAREAYRLLQDWLGDRILVDKTPSYALDPAILERAEETFAGALYIHLVRHPGGMIHSFEEAKLDQIFFRREHPFARRELAELIWLVSHQNILAFLARVPRERQHRVVFEDLLADPAGELGAVCAFLGIELHPGMERLDQPGTGRMTDGIHAESRMLGDVKLLQHAGIDRTVADRWREHFAEDLLGEPARELAAAFGYEARRPVWKPIERRPARPGEPLPLSSAQERLWFFDQMVPGSPVYNIPTAVLFTGRLAVPALTRALDEVVRRHEVLRTTFRVVDGAPAQVVTPPAPLILPLVDLSALPEPERRRAARWLAEAEAWRPFDLERGPLFRAGLVRLAADEHVVLATLHHIAGDGWSMQILNREVAALYKAFSEGKPSPLEPLPIQYADFARWQREGLQGETLDREVASWRERLRGLPPLLELPTDRPRPPVQTFRGATRGLELPPALAQQLQALGREAGATPYMVFLAGFQALLSRYSGQTDLAVGSPIAGRTRRELQDLIGFFVNTLVLRGDLGGEPGFRELLARTRTVSLEAFAHQEMPFEKLVEALAPSRSLGHSPLFQVMFTLQNLGGEEGPAVEGLSAGAVGLEGRVAKFDLTLALSEAGPGFAGSLVYNVDLFDAATAQRLLDHYAVLLAAAAEAPEAPLTGLPLLSDAQRHQITNEWGLGPSAEPAEASLAHRLCGLHELFERWADVQPDAPAVLWEGGSLSYGELERQANRLAWHLRSLGVGPEVRVGLCTGRTAALPVGVLGILKAGGAFVPLDPSYPRERLRWMLADAGLRALVGETAAVADLPAGGMRSVLLDAPPPELGQASPRRPAGEANPESLAYVIYTSGSTGRPKGVLVPHRGLANVAAAQAEIFQVEPGDTVLQMASPAFDAAVAELVTALCLGARLCLAPRESLLPGAGLLDLLRGRAVTHATITPSVLSELPEGSLPHLRTLVVAGEACPAWLVPRWSRGRRLVNAYGPTETTIWATAEVCVPEGGAPAIGRPIPNVRVLVLDAALRPVPPGVAGELCIGGAGVARGYLGLPERTAERFVPDPDGSTTGGRLYRTGDLGRHRSDGRIDFLGRVDQQIKIRGVRIEPEEVEAALRCHPAVRDAAVAVVEDGRGGRRLAAWVVAPGASPPPGAAELRQFLATLLPETMIPSAIASLGVLPLTPNGKLDRRALAALAPEGTAAASQRPLAPMEEIVAAIWSEVLQVEKVGPDDDFFQLGGHSLLATRVVSRLRAALRVELPVRSLFEAPSVAALSRRIAGAVRGEGAAAPPLQPVPRDAALPLSFAQLRLWFIDRLQPGSAAYNLGSAVRFAGLLEVPALSAALAEIVRRHEVLRTTFGERGSEPVQVIHPPAPVPLPVVDLSALPEPGRSQEGARLATAAAQMPFDLARGPLFRAGLLRLGEREHVVLATLHHIAGDGWSFGILHHEVSALYGAFVHRRPSPLPELTVQYADYAVWQREWLSGEVLERELGYWRERLRGIPPVLALPTDRPRPALPTYRAGRRGLRWPPELAGAVRTLGRRRGATLFMVLLAGFQSLLARLSGERSLCVGTPVAGRDRVEIEKLIGFFINTLVLRADFAGDPGFAEVLERVRDASLEAYAHQSLPFEKLVEALAPERSLSHSPLFQVLFVLQNTPESAERMEGLAAESLGSLERGAARYDLALSLRESGDALLGLLEYAVDLFEDVTAGRMLRHLECLLAAAARQPEIPVGELPLLDEGERQQVLWEWNDAPGNAVAPRGLHELFERWADAQPGAPAVLWEGGSLSYGELERRSNRLARHLRSLGVGPEVRVGLCTGRTAALPVGVLGILKAGGAFVPLEPSYPQDRLRWMLADAGVRVLVGETAAVAGLPAGGMRQVLLDEPPPELDRASSRRPAGEADPESLAYVIYTSGSTGRPKGVLVPHRGLANVAAAQAAIFQVEPGDTVLQMASPAFDAAVAELVTALCLGARLYLAGRESLLPGPGLLDLLRGRSVTHATITPPVLAEVPEGELPHLRTLVVAGEACPAWLVARWAPGRRLVNAYGPTETTIWATAEVCVPEEGSPAIGRPIPNARVHVLDEALRPVPVGVDGELCIGGVGVARGYLGLPERTAERFVPDPHGSIAGGRLYRTGDLGRHRADGRIDFLRRVDQQVKVRGVRIEPEEVEAALRRHPAVRDAAVVAQDDGRGGRRLAAWVVASDATPLPGAAELRQFLAAALPEPMIPAAIAGLDALPLTPNGKVDRLALARRAPAQRQAGERVAPRDEVELVLLEIWEEVLGDRSLGVTDDFFQAGGHSLLAVRLMARIRERLGRELPLAALFAGASIERLAALLRQGAPPPRRETLVELRTVAGSRAPLFLVHPAGGNVLCYAELARSLDRSVYGLQMPDPDGEGFPASLEEMAAGYVRAIREARPEPPYHLAGWSLGGVLAFEMARQLGRRDGHAGLLAILDAEPPLTARAPARDEDLLRRFALDLAGLSASGVSLRLPEPGSGGATLEELFDFAQQAGLIPPGLGLSAVRTLFHMFRANAGFLRAYGRPPGEPYPGPALLLLADEASPTRRDELARGWSALIGGGLTVRSVPGNHYSLLKRPNVQSPVEQIREALTRVEP